MEVEWEKLMTDFRNNQTSQSGLLNSLANVFNWILRCQNLSLLAQVKQHLIRISSDIRLKNRTVWNVAVDERYGVILQTILDKLISTKPNNGTTTTTKPLLTSGTDQNGTNGTKSALGVPAFPMFYSNPQFYSNLLKQQQRMYVPTSTSSNPTKSQTTQQKHGSSPTTLAKKNDILKSQILSNIQFKQSLMSKMQKPTNHTTPPKKTASSSSGTNGTNGTTFGKSPTKKPVKCWSSSPLKQQSTKKNVSSSASTSSSMKNIPSNVIMNTPNSSSHVNDEAAMYVANKHVTKIMQRILPATHSRISEEAKELVQECATEFLLFLNNEAKCHSLNSGREFMSGDDVVSATTNLGFENYGIILDQMNEIIKAKQYYTKPIVKKKYYKKKGEETSPSKV